MVSVLIKGKWKIPRNDCAEATVMAGLGRRKKGDLVHRAMEGSQRSPLLIKTKSAGINGHEISPLGENLPPLLQNDRASSELKDGSGLRTEINEEDFRPRETHYLTGPRRARCSRRYPSVQRWEGNEKTGSRPQPAGLEVVRLANVPLGYSSACRAKEWSRIQYH
jgi:hypothetical protein